MILEKSLERFIRHNDHLAHRAYHLRKTLPQIRTNWKCDTYNTIDNYLIENEDDDVIKDLAWQGRQETYEFSQEFGIDEPLEKFRCVDFWFNIAEPGAYQEFHNHSNSHFSLVYYVRTPDHCGNIVFQNPTSQTDMFPLPIKTLNANSYRSCQYMPHEGSILLFRSNLTHMVEKNLSDRDRISIAMNFKIDLKN